MADDGWYQREYAARRQLAIDRNAAIQRQIASGQLRVTKEITSLGMGGQQPGASGAYCTATICDGAGKQIIQVKHFPVGAQEGTESLGARVLAAFKQTPKVANWLAGAGRNISGLFSFSAFTLAPAAVGYAANAKDASNPTKLAAMVDEVKRLGLTPEQVMMQYPGAHVQIIEVLRKEALGMEDA